MPEIGPSGSEGGGAVLRSPYPYCRDVPPGQQLTSSRLAFREAPIMRTRMLGWAPEELLVLRIHVAVIIHLDSPADEALPDV